MKKISLLALFVSFIFITSYAQPSFVKDSLDSYIQQGLKDWNIPGLAIAIIKDGKIVVMKGYGVRDKISNEPVDENTLFMIASNSKLFTGTALAQLEYDGKLSLDDKIIKYFPDFALADSNTTRTVTIKDMLSHHLGTKTFQGDFTFWNSNLSRGEIMGKMKLMEPSGQFRQTFGYCNSCFLTAGEIIPLVSGKPWEVYVYDSILTPLGMSNTSPLGYNMQQMPNAAKPYTTAFTGKLTELPYDRIDNLAPAGSIVSCIKDISKWLMMQLDSGRYNGKQIIPWKAVQKTRDAVTIISSRKSAVNPSHFSAYGLGVFENDFNGRQVFTHTGGADGFVTNTCFVPEEKLAITILTNNDNQAFFELLRYQILDAYTNMPYINRSKNALKDFTKEQAKIIQTTQALQARVKGANPAYPLKSYTGKYTNRMYGDIDIVEGKESHLQVKFSKHPSLIATLQYLDNDEWMISYNHPAFGIFPLKFKMADNKIVSVDVKVSDFIEYDPYTFIKQ